VILDTNVYTALLRNIPEAKKLIDNSSALLLPLPVLAELKYGFIKGTRKEDNETKLNKFLSQPSVSVLLPDYETAKSYSVLQYHCKKNGRVLSNNDVWIAALAYQHEEKLATYDKDFEILESFLGDNLILLQS